MSRSKWFEGFLYAESVFKELGPYEAVRTFDAEVCPYDFSEFDKGIMDYLKLIHNRELIK